MRFLYLSRGVGGAARAASQRGCARVYRGPCPGGARDADALEVLALLVGVALVAALPREEIRHPPAPARAAVARRVRGAARAHARAAPCRVLAARDRARARTHWFSGMRRCAHESRNASGICAAAISSCVACLPSAREGEGHGGGVRRVAEPGDGVGERARARERTAVAVPSRHLAPRLGEVRGARARQVAWQSKPRLQRGESSPRVSSSGLGCVRANVPKI